MTAPQDVPFALWTDVTLQVEAAALLSDHVRIVGPTAADRLAQIEQADAAIVSAQFPGDAATFGRASRLLVVARVGIGIDNIDVSAATAAGICAVNTPDAPTESTAEFTVGLMLAVARCLVVADRNAHAGTGAPKENMLGLDLAGKTLGLVGFGRIARRVAAIVSGLSMRVRAFDPFVPPEVIAAAGVEPIPDLAGLLRGADVVSLHVPLSPHTRALIGQDEIAMLRSDAIVINTSRGHVLDEVALAHALRTGQLGGAGIDVWQQEPPSRDNPLLQLGNVVATPHIAGFTREGRRRSHLAAAQQVVMVLRGEMPPGLCNPAVWPRRRGAAGKVCS